MSVKVLLIWTCFVVLGLTTTNTNKRCSAYCSTCKTPTGTQQEFYTCGTCYSDFITDPDCLKTDCASCMADSAIYVNAADEDGWLLAGESDYQCGALLSGYGLYNTTDSVVIWTTITPIPHYWLTIRVSILYIDYWRNSSIKLYIDSKLGATSTYSGAGNITDQCFIETTRNISDKYQVITYNAAHNDTNFVVSLNGSGNCITRGGGGGGSSGRCSSSSNPCPNNLCCCNWIITEAIVLMKPCSSNCIKCSRTGATVICWECEATYWKTGNNCSTACSDVDGYFDAQDSTFVCQTCNVTCLTCTGNTNGCTSCKTGYIISRVDASTAYCLKNCLAGRYNNTALNECSLCDESCALCTGDPSPCSKCNDDYFLFEQVCGTSCPTPYVYNRVNWTCEDCSVWCVNMTLTRYVPSGGSGLVPLMFNLNFTYAIDWATFDMATFANYAFGGSLYTLDSFNITYTNLSSRAFRITISPYTYAFIINQSVSIKVIARPADDSKYVSADGRPFMDAVFNQTIALNWTYIKPPNMSALEVSIVSEFSTLTTTMNNALATPYVQEFKKLGFLLLFLNSVQITSCLILINTILPENLYEGIRLFASLIFFDVPPWEAESTLSKYYFNLPIQNISRRLWEENVNKLQAQENQTSSPRQLQNIYVDEFTFRRTGFSAYFIYDAYWQIFIILFCYLILGVCLLVSKYWKRTRKAERFIQAALAGFHEISVIYFTLTIVFEVVYFDWSRVKWISIIVCFVVNIYFFLYQLRVYYALLDYPSIAINDPRFEGFVVKYSYYLKWLRFDDENTEKGKWGIFKMWFRPHNYHIQSYVKKFLMMLSFPLFYRFGFAQIIVLIVVQSCEIVRFLVTWPYNSRWRNVYRLTLEGVLLGVFAMVLFIQLIVVRLTSGNTEQAETYATLFFAIGWIAFALVYIFNVGFLVLFCLNWFQNCNYTNREILESSRKNYYFNLLKEQEEKDESVPIPQMAEWMKKGNLYGRRLKELPEISYRVEYYSIERLADGNYALDFKVVFRLEMDSEYNFQPGDNNILAKDVLESKVTLNPLSDIFKVIHTTYGQLSNPQTVFVILKTFMDVDQSQFKCGQAIPFSFKRMTQQAQIHNSNKQLPIEKKLSKMIKGFPLPHDWLIQEINAKQNYHQTDLFT